MSLYRLLSDGRLSLCLSLTLCLLSTAGCDGGGGGGGGAEILLPIAGERTWRRSRARRR